MLSNIFTLIKDILNSILVNKIDKKAKLDSDVVGVKIAKISSTNAFVKNSQHEHSDIDVEYIIFLM